MEEDNTGLSALQSQSDTINHTMMKDGGHWCFSCFRLFDEAEFKCHQTGRFGVQSRVKAKERRPLDLNQRLEEVSGSSVCSSTLSVGFSSKKKETDISVFAVVAAAEVCLHLIEEGGGGYSA